MESVWRSRCLCAALGAISLIIQRHPIHSALSLIVVMVALAGLYLLQGAEFVAAVQIIVYAGAIMVLFIFVIMLLNAGEEERSNLSRHGAVRGSAAGRGVPRGSDVLDRPRHGASRFGAARVGIDARPVSAAVPRLRFSV